MSKQIDAHILELYQVESLLGSGAYGHVWKVVDRKTQQELALKKIFDAFQNSTDAQRTYREITVLQQLNHHNIIKLERVIRAKNDRDLYLLFEYMQADLHSILGDNILEPIHQRFIVYQLLVALKYLHSAHLIHRDLKPSNVLINSECEVKLCDFGLVRSLMLTHHDEQLVLSEEIATRWYRSPEILLGSHTYDKPVDMWSIGCIIWEMLTGNPLFPGNSTIDQLEKILTFTGRPTKSDLEDMDNAFAQQLISQAKFTEKNRSEYFAGVDGEFADLISRLLEFNPKRRLSAEEALELEMFEEFRNDFDEMPCSKVIMPGVSDNIRLGLKKYRIILYSEIDKRYPPVHIPVDKKSKSKEKKPPSPNGRSKSKESNSNNKSSKKPSLQTPLLSKTIKSPSRLFTGASTALDKEKQRPSIISKKPLKKHGKAQLPSKMRSYKSPVKSPAMLPFEELHKLYKYLK